MKRIVTTALLLLATAASAGGADIGVPKLSDGMTPRNVFEPNRLLTTGNVSVGSARSFTLTPQLGIGYFNRGREARPGIDEAVHSINAQAGGRFDLLDVVYFSAVAKLPVYTYDVLDRRLAGIASTQERTARHQYDLFQSPSNNLTWTGEVGLKLNPRVDLNLFYDQTRFSTMPVGTAPSQSEERFGTRFIFHFK